MKLALAMYFAAVVGFLIGYVIGAFLEKRKGER